MDSIPILIVLIFPLMLLSSWNSERKRWNKGYCRTCGQPWKQFDTDSQGGRMYKDKHEHWIVISYPFIDK